MSRWIRKPRECKHCGVAFFARGPKFYCSVACELKGRVKVNGDCWEWQGPFVYKYGQIRLGPPFKSYRAHRVAYQQFVGPIPDGLCVCHRCDNPPCINPAHLFLATNRENTRDKVRKQRQNRGVTHGMTRLTPEAVEEIRASPRKYGVAAALGRKYGVTTAAIVAVRNRKNWKHSP